MIRLVTIAALAAMVLSPARAQDFNAEETDTMNHALMDYAMTWPANYLYENRGGFDFYLNLQGHDPTEKFLDSFGAAGGKLKPFSRAVGLRASKAMMESGHNVMKVSVSDFHAIAPDTAQVYVDARCGMTCGGQNIVTLQKFGDVWEVTSFKTTSVE